MSESAGGTIRRDLTMKEAARAETGARVDLLTIASMVQPGSRVLDVGCGDGELMEILINTRRCDARGIELSREGVNAGVARGLAVIQGDADVDLADYPDDSFDYVILSQTIQATRRPKWVLEQMLRVGRHAIVSFPNFGFWRMRLDLLVNGRMPRTENLPYSWHDTPNIHFCTIRDFEELVRDLGMRIDRRVLIDATGRSVRGLAGRAPNLLAERAVYSLGT